MEAVLIILLVQGVLGGADNLLHHELQAKLPARASARRELVLHASREAIYGVVFLALAWTMPTGLWAWGLALLLAIEVAITAADFVEEDRTRQLPPAERVLHLMLAVAYGAFLAVLAPHLIDWMGQPSGLALTGHGWLSVLLTPFGIGVAVWSARNFIATARTRQAMPEPPAHETAGHRGTMLVTGGTGFIGTALVRALVADGQRVIVLSRDLRQARAQFAARRCGPVFVVDDLDMLPAETRIDAVVDLAGAPVLGPPWTPGRKRTLIRSRVGTTGKVVALIRRLERRPAVLVGASAVGFYGIDGRAPVDETAPGQRDFASRLCQLRETATAEAAALGVRCVSLRLGIVLGREGGVLPPMALASRLGLGAVLGDGAQAMPWIHIADAVGLIRFAVADASLRGPMNATAPDTVDQAEFAQALAGAYGRVARMRIAAGLLRLVLGAQASLLLSGRPVLPTKALASGYRFRFSRLAAALGDLTKAGASETAAGEMVSAETETRGRG